MGCCADKKDKCCGIGFHSIPAALGDDTGEFKPENGAYHNMLVKYEENGAVYLYTNDGVPIKISGGCECGDDAPILITLSYADTNAWQLISSGVPLRIDQSTVTVDQKINTREVPSVGYQKTGDSSVTYTAEEVFNLLESRADVIFMNVPLGWSGTGQMATGVTGPAFNTNGLRTTGRKKYQIWVSEADSADVVEHSGITYYNGLPLGYGIARYTVGDTVEYKFFVQGIDTYSFT